MDEIGQSQEMLPIGDILKQLDKKCPDKGVKPSEAWTYRHIIMRKYGLPESTYRWNDPKRYIEQIEEIAKEHGVKIRSRHEFELFFKENPKAKAWFHGKYVFHDSMMVTTPLPNEEEWFQLRAKANQLSHEIVHALQQERYPRMPVEEQEREAYYSKS